MYVILPIFTSDGKAECSHLYISLAELAANSSLYIVVSLVTEFDISLMFLGWLVFRTLILRFSWQEEVSIGTASWFATTIIGPISNVMSSLVHELILMEGHKGGIYIMWKVFDLSKCRSLG